MTLRLGPENHGKRKSSLISRHRFPAQTALLFCSLPNPHVVGIGNGDQDRPGGHGAEAIRVQDEGSGEDENKNPTNKTSTVLFASPQINFTEAVPGPTKPARQAPPSPVPVAEAPSPRPARETGACDWTRLLSIILKNFSWLAG